MKTFISSCVIVLLVVFVSPALILGEEPVPVPLPSAEMETDSSDPDNQGVQSRGFFPKLPPSPKAPKMRSLSTNEKNLAKAVFGNTINYDVVKVTDTLGSGARPWTTNSPLCI